MLQAHVHKRSSIGIWSERRSVFLNSSSITDRISASKSSEDSMGADSEQQKQMYDDAVSRHPDSVLSLQHEVYGELPLSALRLITIDCLSNFLF